MSRDKGNLILNKRIIVFNYFIAVVVLAIILRLVYMQIFNADHYKLLADNNRIVTNKILPDRGLIVDSKGYPLAMNADSFSVFFDTGAVRPGELDEMISYVVDHLDISESSKDKLLAREFKKNTQVLLKENLTWDELARFYTAASIIPGITISKTKTRKYLCPEEFSHIIGYVGSPTKEDVEMSSNSSLSLPMAKIGKTCIEKYYDERLFGVSGLEQTEVNSRRKKVRDINTLPAIQGETIQLSINRDLQKEVYRILSSELSAACVVMDVHSGAVLSFVSYPGYDTNIFNVKFKGNKLKDLYEDPYKPMINKALTGLYSPGSTFKMVTALAGLQYGAINKFTTFNCIGHMWLGNHKFHCWRWRYDGHGYIGLRRSLSESCDVYFFQTALLTGADNIANVANDFGLGVPTGIDLPNEKSGLIPTKKWKKEKRKQSWTQGDSLNMSIGQGFTLTTPLQLARMTAIMVNGQKQITPRVVKNDSLNTPEVLNYKKEHIDLIKEGMFDAINSPTGTARRSATEDNNFILAGKTGSTQVCRITEKQRQERKTTSDDYLMKEHALFVGYAPADNPKYSICVLVEHGGSGSKAALLAKDIMLAVRDLATD